MAADGVSAIDGDRRPGPAPVRELDEGALLAAAEAVADCTWGRGSSDSSRARPVDAWPELQIIADIARVHTRATTIVDGASEESDQSLGDVFSRALTPPTGAPDLAGARRWGPLWVLDHVGSGSFGQVYRAWEPLLAREVALKILRSPSTSAQSDLAIREGQIAVSVRHPNIISVLGAAHVDGEVGIWMEFLRGRTLEHIVLQDGGMSADEALLVLRSLGGALAAVHGHGLLHRDVKASNAMREHGGRYVLIDFGTGIDLTPGERDHRLAGTPLYMAPEVLERRASASVQSDIYSLGVLMFFLVTGSFPVYGKTLEQVRAAHRERRRVALASARADLPAPFVRVVDRMLSVDPENRPDSVSECLALIEDNDRRPPKGLVAVLLASLLLIGTPFMCGLVTTSAYNSKLGRVGPMASDSLSEIWLMGYYAIVTPAIYVAVMLLVQRLGLALVRAGARFAAARPSTRAAQRWTTISERWRALPANLLAEWVMWLQLVGLITACVALWDVLWAAIAPVSHADPSLFAPLAPGEPLGRHVYRIAFSVLLVLMVDAWLLIHRRRTARTAPDRTTIAAGAALLAATLACLVLPYRVTWRNVAERVAWDGERCYITGTSGTHVLLYCPDAPPPKVQHVPRDGGFVPSGQFESIFTPRSR